MLLISSTGLISIIAIVLWVFVMPFIYPRYIEKYLTDRVIRRHAYISGNFLLSYSIVGILLIFFDYIVSGIIILSILLAAYQLMRFFLYDSYTFVLDILYDKGKTIAYYIFVSGVLLTGIIKFYSSDWGIGVILCWGVFFNILTTAIGLVLLNKSLYLKTVNEQVEDAEEKEIDIDSWNVYNLFDYFTNTVNEDIEGLLEGVNSSLGHLLKFVYSDLIPEKYWNCEINQLESIINAHLLNDKTVIPEKEKQVIIVLLKYKNELMAWSKKSNDLYIEARIKKEGSLKKQEVSKKKVKKIIKDIKKDNKSPRFKKSENKPGHSISPDN